MRDGLTLKVEDTGFGNVLKGLEFNINAMAKVGAEVEVFPLDGIGPAIEAFRACPEALTS